MAFITYLQLEMNLNNKERRIRGFTLLRLELGRSLAISCVSGSTKFKTIKTKD